MGRADTLTEVGVAEGHLWVGWDAGTGSAGGCQPQQQQDARGQGCKGGHGAFCGGGEEGSEGPQLSRSMYLGRPPTPFYPHTHRVGEFGDFKGLGDLRAQGSLGG